MLKLAIDPKLCTRCAICELYLPGVIELASQPPGVMISRRNPDVNRRALRAALTKCPSRAMQLTEVNYASR